MESKDVAVYCRVDRGACPEARPDTLEIQRKKLERYAQVKGLCIVKYYEDNGFSGCDSERPGLLQMIKDYEAGVFTRVLVVNEDRLYRGNRQNWPFPIISLNPLEKYLER